MSERSCKNPLFEALEPGTFLKDFPVLGSVRIQVIDVYDADFEPVGGGCVMKSQLVNFARVQREIPFKGYRVEEGVEQCSACSLCGLELVYILSLMKEN